MHFDVPTLMAVGSFVSSVVGLLLLYAWFSDRSARSLLWWAAGDLVWAASAALILAFGARLGDPLIVLGPALVWTAARTFNRQKPSVPLILAGPAAQLLSGLVSPITTLPFLPDFVMFGSIAVYLFAATGELLSRREEELATRWPLVAFLTLHGSIFAIGAGVALSAGFPGLEIGSLSNWFGVVHFEQVIFAMGSAIFLVAMTGERRELRHRIAAHFDALTGTLTRGAFLERAGFCLADCQQRDVPLSVALFDLDRFKQINDRHGHSAGDHALRDFARVAQSRLRAKTDFIGRLGGEEFCVVMPGSNADTAYLVAERIRAGLAGNRIELNGETLPVTVSGGVAAASIRSTVEQLIEAADAALYRAKALGRNRIEMAGDDRAPGVNGAGTAMVARVA